LLSGSEALVRGLAAARVRRAWSFPGSPLTKAEQGLDHLPAKGPLRHQFTVNENVAATLALGGALLTYHGTAMLMKHVGINVAMDALSSFGAINELRSACLLVEGLDPTPKSSQNAQDNRGSLANVARLPQIEAATPDEIYHLLRIGALASLRGGLPIVIRVGRRGLDAKEDLHELPPDLPEGTPTFARAAGPYVCTADTYRFHTEKRARRLQALLPLAEALAQPLGPNTDGGTLGVVMAGHLTPQAQARAWARRCSSLRLGMCWPLPKKKLLEFLRDREEVLVLEEGEPFLESELQAMAHREGLGCRVVGAGGRRPQLLDDDRLDQALNRFAGRLRAESDPPLRDALAWRAVYEATMLPPDDGEPWALHLARIRGSLPGFSPNDPRATLLRALRGLDRPTLIAADPSASGVLGIRDRLVDVKMQMGGAAPTAGALAEAVELEERAGAGAPLAVALIGDTNHYHSEINGILDNAIARREVLHVLIVNRKSEMTSGVRTPYLSDEALEAQLRSAGLQVATAQLDDPGLSSAVQYVASRSGPRALVCYAAPEKADKGDKGGDPTGQIDG
jgi:TPP-dependent indolepyruvate ferredoxin oxidoreductase alpha subunit